jgi:hypothetical protein
MTVPNTTYRVLVEKLGASDPSQFVGNEGEVFYDPNNPELKLSDGTTIGGVSIGGTGGGGGGEESYWVQTSAGIHTLSNVGIGTTNPTSALTVSGDASVSGIVTVGEIETLVGSITNLKSGNLDVENIFTTSQFGVNIGAGGNNNLIVLENEVRIQNVPLKINSGKITFPNTTEQTTAYTGISTGINSLVESELSVDSFRYRISNTGQPQVLSSDIERGLVWSTVDSSNTVITGGSSGGGLAIVGITTWVGLTTTTLTTWGDSSVAHIVEPSTASGYKVTFVLSVASGGNRGGIHVEKLF